MLWMAALTTLVASGIAMGFPVPFFIVGRRRLLPLRWLSCKPLRTCRATCPDRRAGELLVGTPLCGAVASNSREVATAWAYLGLVLQEPYWGEAAENDCFHPAFDCLNPRLLSAQPWELLRIPLVGPEARTSSVPIQLSLLLVSLPAWSAACRDQG